jgi:hypothetical protein
MRVLFAATIALSCATGAAAQSIPDRYGPARPTATRLAVVAYSGPVLSWASKSAAPAAPAILPAAPLAAPATAPPQAPASPVATLDDRTRTLGRVEGPSPVAPPVLNTFPEPQDAAPRPVYAPVASVAAPAPSPMPVLAGGPPVAVRAPLAAVTPRTIVPASISAPAPAPAFAAPVAAPVAGPPTRIAAAGAPARYYSLHREYGLTPDPAPPQSTTPRYVLVGPPDRAAGDKPRDAEASSDSLDSSGPF